MQQPSLNYLGVPVTKLHNNYARGGRVTRQGSVFMFEVVFEEIAWGKF